MRFRRLAAVLFALLGLALLVRPGHGLAQQTEAIRITDIDGYVEFGVERRTATRSRSGVSRNTFDKDDLEFQQMVEIRGQGFAYHPRFLVFSLGTHVNLGQVSSRGEIESNDHEHLGGYGRLNFLSQHPFGLTLFGDQRQSTLERAFTRSYTIDRTLYGATFHSRRGPIPFQLSYAHRERKGDEESEDIDEVGDDWTARGRYQLAEASGGELEYLVTREEIRLQDIDRQSFNASNITAFGPNLEKRFHGYIRNYRQSDDTGTRDFKSGSGNLSWQHTPTLSSSHSFYLQRTDAQESTVDSINLNTSVTHRLYGSLRNTAEGYVRFTNATFGDEQRLGGALRQEYSKRLGRWGRLLVNLTPHGELLKNRPKGTIGFRFDESIDLVDALGVELGELDIDRSTVVVSDLSGARYDEGGDYIVVPRGRATEIRRLITGDIGDGETVLVDYEYRLPGTSDVLESGVDAGISVSLRNGLAFYWRRVESTQDRLSGNPGVELEARRRRTMGVQFSRSWIYSEVAYEIDDSTIGPYRATTETLSLFTPFGYRLRGQLLASYRQQSYIDTDEDIDVLLFNSVVSLALRRTLYWEFDAEYQRESWSGRDVLGLNDMHGFGLRTTLHWRLPRFEFEIGYRYGRIERAGDNEDEKESRLFVRAKREF